MLATGLRMSGFRASASRVILFQFRLQRFRVFGSGYLGCLSFRRFRRLGSRARVIKSDLKVQGFLGFTVFFFPGSQP